MNKDIIIIGGGVVGCAVARQLSRYEASVAVLEGGSDVGMTLLMILLIPAAIAGVACGVMTASMKTARAKTQADDYRREVNVLGRRDRFITRTVVRQKIESSSSSSSSRGGTRVNSGGFSGKSGKF